MNKRGKWPLAILAFLAIAGAVFTLINYLNKPIIPASISSQLEFSPQIVTAKPEGFVLGTQTVAYDSTEKILTYDIAREGNTITITQQAYPEILIYEKLVNSMQVYQVIDTKAGKVSLTRPKNLKGQQVAVLNKNNQVLLFAKPTTELNEAEWRQIFNSLKTLD